MNQEREKFREICSEQTLQANREGFFLNFAEEVARNVGPELIQKHFGKSKTDRQRIRAVFQTEPIKGLLCELLSHVQEVYRGKCTQTAQRCRKEAEEMLRRGETRRALQLYSQSVLKAPQKGDSSLALALLGRAEPLLLLGRPLLALEDLQLCLKEQGLDLKLRSEAFWKISKCYEALQEDPKAKIALDLSQKLLGIGQNPETVFELQKLPPNCPEPKPLESRELCVPEVVGERHPELRNGSGKIEVKESKELGRYVVAKDNITTGEVLVVESPSAACLFPEKFGTHCHHCFTRLVAPVGCQHCSSVAFCRQKCRDLATPYHRFECKFLDLLIGSGMSVLSHTALRLVTQTDLQTALQLGRNVGESPSGSGTFGLCINASKRDAKDFLQRTLMAAFLLRILQESGYFDGAACSGNVVPNTEEEYQIGETLLVALQMLQFNAHEVSEKLHGDQDRFKGAKLQNVGVAIYPTVALFNHECCPAVARHFVGKQIVVTALRPLSPGEVISENYGPIFTCRNLKERQRSLAGRYWFDCQCIPCREDWPTLQALKKSGADSEVVRLRCPSKNCSKVFALKPQESRQITCPSCKGHISLEEVFQILKDCEVKYEDAERCFRSDPQRAMRILGPALDSFHRISTPPHGPTHLAQEILKACLTDSGNSYQCLVKIEK